jgi:membrane protein implicated in regulation of membrane protease activity
VVVLLFALRAQKTPIRIGRESLVGRVGMVKETIPLVGCGQVQLASERWTAELMGADEPALPGTRVEVVEVEGVHLKVRPVA